MPSRPGETQREDQHGAFSSSFPWQRKGDKQTGTFVWMVLALLPASVSRKHSLLEAVSAVLGRAHGLQVVKGSWVYRPGLQGLPRCSQPSEKWEIAEHGREDIWGADGATTGPGPPKRGLMSRKAKLLGAESESQTNQRTTLLPSGPVLRRSWGPGSPFLSFPSCPARVSEPLGEGMFPVTLRPGAVPACLATAVWSGPPAQVCAGPPGRIAPPRPVLRGAGARAQLTLQELG